MSRWIDRDGGRYCTAHDQQFPLGENCSFCISEPGAPPDAGDAEEAPDAADLRARETELLNLARSFERKARDFLDGTDREANAACKCADVAIKCRRLALEIRDRLATQSEIADLIRKYRELLAMDGAH